MGSGHLDQIQLGSSSTEETEGTKNKTGGDDGWRADLLGPGDELEVVAGLRPEYIIQNSEQRIQNGIGFWHLKAQ